MDSNCFASRHNIEFIASLCELSIYIHFFLVKDVKSKLSFSTDCWTTKNTLIPFMGITAHWISDDWVKKHLCVKLIHLQGTHTGENLSDAFTDELHNKKNILHKVQRFTSNMHFIIIYILFIYYSF